MVLAVEDEVRIPGGGDEQHVRVLQLHAAEELAPQARAVLRPGGSAEVVSERHVHDRRAPVDLAHRIDEDAVHVRLPRESHLRRIGRVRHRHLREAVPGPVDVRGPDGELVAEHARDASDTAVAEGGTDQARDLGPVVPARGLGRVAADAHVARELPGALRYRVVEDADPHGL